MDLLLYAAIMMVPVIGVVVFIAARQRAQRQGWGTLAQKHGLTLRSEGEEPTLEGVYRGRPMSARVITSRVGRTMFWSTHVALALKRAPGSAAVVHYNQYGLSGKDREKARRSQWPDLVDTGDAEIDRNFVVLAPSAPLVGALFAPGSHTRSALVALHRGHPGKLTIDGGMLTFERAERLVSEEKMQHLLDLLSDAADGVEQLN